MPRALDFMPSVGLRYTPARFMNRLFDELSRPLFDVEPYSDWLPPADITETDSNYVVSVEVPGMDMKGLDISFDEGNLIIKGDKKVAREVENESSYCTERYFGSFERRLRIPGHIKQEKIDATYHDGVLKVTLPKDEKSKPRKIQIH